MRPNTILPTVFALLVATAQLAVAATGGAPQIVIDGSQLPSDVPALVVGNHVLVPLRGVFEQFGAAVSFDETSGIATAMLGQASVRVQVGSTRALVDGRAQTMDVAAREVAGRVMIPLRFVAQALGVSVDYDAASNTVVIVSGLRPGSFAAYAGGPVYATVARVAPTVESVRPESGTIVGSQYPSIYARFAGGTSAVDPATVQIQLDGQDVTDQSTVSSAYVSYTPMEALSSGSHNVTILGRSQDGTPFQESWSFRVDAGSAADYTVGSYGGGGFGAASLGFGWPWFNRFGFFPPGFSVFTPGPLFLVSGGFIEVVFISRFFPFGSGFFTISGIPGQFALTPWLGQPGMFWGAVQVPAGVVATNAVLQAHFMLPDGRRVAVNATAPLHIDGERRSLPSDLRYAVEPQLRNRPATLAQAVFFDRTEPRRNAGVDSGLHSLGSAARVGSGNQAGPFQPFRAEPGAHQPVRGFWQAGTHLPVTTRLPAIGRHPVEPVRTIEPTMPVFRPALPQWQTLEPSRPILVRPPIKP